MGLYSLSCVAKSAIIPDHLISAEGPSVPAWKADALEGDTTEFPSIKEKIIKHEEVAAKPQMVTRSESTTLTLFNIVPQHQGEDYQT
jgi:hypothetical protein